MTNPGEDAGQTASSGSDEGASEPTSTSREAPPIDQQTGQHDDITAVYRQPVQPFEPPAPASESPAYTPPPAYDPGGYQSPPPYQSTPGAPGYPPPPPGFGPPPPDFGAPPSGYGPPPPGFGAPPPGYGPPPPGFGAPSPGYPAPDYGAYGPPPTQKTNGMAIGSLVASIVGICCGIGSIAGIVLGVLAMNQVKQRGEKGHGLAIAGIVVGGFTLLINVAFTIAVISSG